MKKKKYTQEDLEIFIKEKGRVFFSTADTGEKTKTVIDKKINKGRITGCMYYLYDNHWTPMRAVEIKGW